jgi:hypothetical protein
MGKPPPSDAQLEQRVEQLERRADEADAAIASLDARVSALEDAATLPVPPDGTVDNTLPTPPVRPDNTLPEPEPPIEPPIEPVEPPVVEPGQALTASYFVPTGPNAGNYVFCEQGGDGQVVALLDPYQDPDGAFAMSCVGVTRADVPLQVIFRRTAGWSCIIFECCDALSEVNQSVMPASGTLSTVTISEGGSIVDVVEFWGQWAYGRWRWQSGPWPFPKDPAVLRAKHWLPLMDPNALGAPPAKPHLIPPYEPMHLPPGAPLYVGQGGDPTMFAEIEGYWLCHPEDADALPQMLTAAEGLCSYPWFMRDSTTWGAPDIWHTYPSKTTWMPAPAGSLVSLNFTGTPGAQLGSYVVTDELDQQWGFTWQPYAIIGADGTLPAYGMVATNVYPGPTEPSGPFTINAPAGMVTDITKVDGTFSQGSGMTIDGAHSGSMWVAPWLATGDPYWLEALHAKYVFQWMGVVRQLPRPTLHYGQIREAAWQLISLIISAATTPENTPSWVLPRQLWQELWADELRLWDDELVHGTTPGSTVFHTLGVTAGGAQSGPSLATWQEDMILQVMSWASMLLPDCKWAAEWKAQDQIARTNGQSGWNEYFPEGYYINVGPTNGVWYQSWGEAWSENQKVGGVPTPDPTELASSGDYCGQLRAGMALATQAGLTEVTAPLATLTERMTAAFYTDGWHRLFASV